MTLYYTGENREENRREMRYSWYVVVTKEQTAALTFVNTAREQMTAAEQSLAHFSERLHVACARAVATGVPLRRVADHAGVSHATVKRWIEALPTDALDGSRLVARARAGGHLTFAERRELKRSGAGQRPGARGRRAKRKGK